MAKLEDFTISSDALANGEWLSPGEEFDDFEIKLRPFDDAYQNARTAKMRRAAVRYSGDVGRIPANEARDIVVACLEKHTLLDIRNLSHASGAAVTLAEFIDLIRTERGSQFFSAVVSCATRAGQAKVEAEKEAAGN